ncbi:MAG: tetratricopeptide repeat protein [Bacteroidales bacterium]|nr:tetratricopeptide repeat protein [Bacteroidales bacterium]
MKQQSLRILLLIILSNSLVCTLYSNKIDSLRQAVICVKSPDPFQVYLLAKEYLTLSLDTAELYAQMSLKLAEEKKDRHARGYALWTLGNIRYYNNNTDSAMFYYQAALQIMSDLNDKTGIGKVYNTIGMVYDIKGDYTAANEYYHKAYNISQEVHDTINIAATLNNIGILHYFQGDYNTALEYLQKSMKIEEKTGNLSGVLYSLNNIGSIYQETGEFLEATKCYQEVLYRCTEINDLPGMAQACLNLGTLHNIDGDYLKAIKFLNKALKHYNQLGDMHSVALTYITLGESYKGQKDYDIALQNLTLAYDLETKLGDQFSLAKLLKSIGDIYVAKNQIDRALIYYNESNIIAVMIGYRSQLVENYKALSDLYKNLNLYEEALHYYTLSSEVRDSIINAESQKKIAELRTIYDTEKKQRRIETLETENELKELRIGRARYLTLSLIVLILFIVGLGYLFLRQNRLKSRQANMELEQKLFRLQMNPHFIFNSVSAIQSYIMKNEPLEASSYLSNFAKLMRLMLQNSREEIIPLELEIETLRYYLDLQKLRLRDKMNYTLLVDEEIDTSEVGIPPMLAQPFIENSIEHGIMKKEKGGNINISITETNGLLLLEVEDDGPGRNNGENTHTKGHLSMSTHIADERLRLLERKYKRRAAMEYIDLKDNDGKPIGTKVNITIPIIYIN